MEKLWFTLKIVKPKKKDKIFKSKVKLKSNLYQIESLISSVL